MQTKKPPLFSVCFTRPQLMAVRRALIEHYAEQCKQAQSESHDGWDEPMHGERVHDAWLSVNRVINSLP